MGPWQGYMYLCSLRGMLLRAWIPRNHISDQMFCYSFFETENFKSILFSRVHFLKALITCHSLKLFYVYNNKIVSLNRDILKAISFKIFVILLNPLGKFTLKSFLSLMCSSTKIHTHPTGNLWEETPFPAFVSPSRRHKLLPYLSPVDRTFPTLGKDSESVLQKLSNSHLSHSAIITY